MKCSTFSVLVLCIHIQHPVNGIIQNGPLNVAAVVNSNVRLTCILDHRSCNDMMWLKTEESGKTYILFASGIMYLSYGGRYGVNVSAYGECTLNINKLEMSDAGVFQCTEPSAVGQPVKAAVLSVLGSDAQLQMNATENDIADGEAVTLTCSVSYSSQLDVVMSVMRGEESISSIKVDEDSSTMATSVTVVASRPTFGPFQCKTTFSQPSNDYVMAQNAVQHLVAEIPALGVLYPVTNLRLDPPDLEIVPGQPVTCTAEGYPPPTYSWLILPDNTSLPGASLTRNESTSNTYICIATNTVRGTTYTLYSYEINFNATVADSAFHVSSSSNPLLLILLLAGAAFVTIVVVVIVYFVWKRRTSLNEGDDDEKSSRNVYEGLARTPTASANQDRVYERVQPTPPQQQNAEQRPAEQAATYENLTSMTANSTATMEADGGNKSRVTPPTNSQHNAEGAYVNILLSDLNKA